MLSIEVAFLIGALVSNGRLPAVPTQEAQLASQIGLTPEALAAAGLEPDAVAGVLSRLAGERDERTALTQANAAASAAASNVTRFRELAQVEDITRELSRQMDAADAALEAANIAVLTAQHALIESALSPLSTNAATVIRRCVASAGHVVPPEFKSASLTNDEWELLESSLVAERRAARRQTELPTRFAIALSETRSLSTVVQAAQNRAANLEQVRTTFESYRAP